MVGAKLVLISKLDHTICGVNKNSNKKNPTIELTSRKNPRRDNLICQSNFGSQKLATSFLGKINLGQLIASNGYNNLWLIAN